jgi:hypothetical protein
MVCLQCGYDLPSQQARELERQSLKKRELLRIHTRGNRTTAPAEISR